MKKGLLKEIGVAALRRSYKFFDHGWDAAKTDAQMRTKDIIARHNARILNKYQDLGLGDERVLFAPIEQATQETFSSEL